MRRLTLLLLAFLLAAGLALVQAGPATAGGDNAAIAINTKDGSSLFRLAFSIRKVAGDVVDNQNAAVAYSKCQRCKTTAIAIQIVLVTGTPSTVTPTNVAVAVNENCTLCETFASAYQFALSTGGPVRFTPEGRQELAAIRKALRDLRNEDLSPAELQTSVKALMGRLRTVLATQLVPTAPGDDEAEEQEDVEEEDEVEADDEPTGAERVEDRQSDTVTTTPTAETETRPAETTPTTTETETMPTTTETAP
jgi:putative peptide zinc metalloprotease protein